MKFKDFWIGVLASGALSNPLSFKGTGKAGKHSAKKAVRNCHDLSPAGSKLFKKMHEKKLTIWS